MDQFDDARTTRRRRRALSWRLGAMTLATTAALAGCGGHAATTSTTTETSPVAAPSVDDAAVSIVPPTEGPAAGTSSAAPSQAAVPVPTASDGAAAEDPVVPQPQAVTGASRGKPRIVPGIADGAVALPPAATVADDGKCRVSDLKLAPVDLQGSPGGTYADFQLVNVSHSTCAVRGYVSATLIGDNGKDLVTSVRHEDAPDVWVKVAPKGSAQFHLRFTNPFAGATACNPPNAPKVRIGLAGVGGTLTSATPEGGIQACNGQLSTAPLGST